MRKIGILFLLFLAVASIGYLLTRDGCSPMIAAKGNFGLLFPSMSALSSSTEKPSVEEIEKILAAEGFLVIPASSSPDTLPVSLTVIDTGEDLSAILTVDEKVLEWTKVEVLRIPRPWDRWSIAFRTAPFEEPLLRIGGSFRFWTPSRRLGGLIIADIPTEGEVLSGIEAGLGISYRLTTSLQAEVGEAILTREGLRLTPEGLLDGLRIGLSFRF